MFWEYDDDDDDDNDDACVEEMAHAKAVLRRRFQYSSKFHAMKYNQEMENISKRPEWKKDVDEDNEDEDEGLDRNWK